MHPVRKCLRVARSKRLGSDLAWQKTTDRCSATQAWSVCQEADGERPQVFDLSRCGFRCMAAKPRGRSS